MSVSQRGPEVQPVATSPEVRRNAEQLDPLGEKVMEAIFEAQIREQREHYKEEAKKKLSRKKKGVAPPLPSTQAIEQEAKKIAKKNLLEVAEAVLKRDGVPAPTEHDTEERARIIAEEELKANDKLKRDGALAVITILLNSPSSTPEQIAEALVNFGKLHSLRGGHVKDEARVELVNLLNANNAHRKLIEKTIIERQEVFDALADVLVLFSMSEIGAISILALRDKITGLEQAGALAAAKKAVEAQGSPEEIRKAAEFATKRADRLTNVLAAIARKDAEAGSFTKGEKLSKDFWRLQGRAMTHWLEGHPKAKTALKFAGYGAAGFGVLGSIGAILVAMASVLALAGAGYVSVETVKQVFGGGWKKPSGGGGGGHSGGGGGH